MYPYIGDMASYDLVGFICLILTTIYSYFVIKKSSCFPGRYSLFFINYFSKKNKKSITRKLSSKKFWTKLEKVSVLFTIVFTFSFGERILRENFSFISRDYYNIIFLTTLLLLFLFYALRLNFLPFLDSMVPVLAISSFALKHACFFRGCCYGFECTWGFYNFKNDATEVPIQLIEAYISLIIFFVILFYKKRKTENGILFPVFLIMYSLGRIGISFFRACDIKILPFLTDYQIKSIVGLFVGILLLAFFSKIQRLLLTLFDREPLPGYMKYKRNHNKKIIHSKKK